MTHAMNENNRRYCAAIMIGNDLHLFDVLAISTDQAWSIAELRGDPEIVIAVFDAGWAATRDYVFEFLADSPYWNAAIKYEAEAE